MTEPGSDPLDRILADLDGLEADERTRRLAALEREDPDLHLAVTRRIDESTSGATFRDRGDDTTGIPAAETMTDARIAPGMRIGPCHLVRLLGEGGMGAVYEARQEGLDRPVAIKFMKSGIVSKSARARFLHEAKLLSRLRHPGIAQVHEVGLHDLGAGRVSLPYYVLELVPDARPLGRWVAEQRLDDRALIELYVAVAQAVVHGHRLGVIHRDLKPANILVDPEGRPKVIDFGLARTEDDQLVTRSFETETGAIVGTLPYMSPEQLGGGEQVDTRSDIYALGVILYELLTGHRPHEFRGKSLPEAVAMVRETAPPRPRRFRPDLSVDLETICLKALRKDPDERYASVDALIEDLERWSRGLPVLARPQSAAYAFRLYARRNKALVGAMAAFLVLLVAATIVALELAREARLAEEAASRSAAAEKERREQAERLLAASTGLADWLVLDHLDQLARLPGGTRTTEATTARILDWLESMRAEAGDDRDMQRSLALATLEVGSVLGSPSRPNLGRTEEALDHIRRAEEVFAARLKDEPDDLESLVDLVAVRLARAEIEPMLGRFDEAETALGEVESLLARGRAVHPKDARLAHAEAQFLRDRGQLAENRGRLEEGLELVHRALALRRDLIARDLRDDKIDEDRALLVDRMAEMRLLAGLGRDDEVVAIAEEILPELRTRGDDDVIVGNDLAYVLTQLADSLVSREDQRERALELYAEARNRRRDLLEHDPDDSARKRALALAEERLGFSLALAGRPDEALAHLEAAEERLREILAAAPSSREARVQLRILLGRLVAVRGMLGLKTEACAAADEALAIARGLVTDDSEDFGARRALGEALMGRGGALIQSMTAETGMVEQRTTIEAARAAFAEARRVFRDFEKVAERPVWLDSMLAACDQYVAVCDQTLEAMAADER